MNNVVDFIKLNSSAQKPVTNKEIGAALNLSEQAIRQNINKARCEGIPICATSKGYFYSKSKWDILDTVRSLNSRVISVEKAVNGMLKALFEAL